MASTRSHSQHGNGYNGEPQGFGVALRPLREARRMSQSKRAEGADFDHSYVSRRERGARMPTVDAGERLSKALGLRKQEADTRKAAAGFLPDGSGICRYPLVSQLDSAIAGAPDHVRANARDSVSALVAFINQPERAQRP